MKLVYTGNFLAIFTFLLFLVVFGGTYAGSEPSFHQTRFLVKIPPPIDADAYDQERFRQFQKVLFPPEEIPDTLPENLPYSCGLLIITLEKDGYIKINYETYGNLSDPRPLIGKLREIFRYREENGVIAEKTHQPVKAVMLKALRSSKYGDVTKVVDALKESGADPIVLQIDYLPK